MRSLLVLALGTASALAAPAFYRAVYKDKACGKGSLPNYLILSTGGANAVGLHRSETHCRGECSKDDECRFFLWKDDPAAMGWRYHCVLYRGCPEQHDYMDGDGGTIYEKTSKFVPTLPCDPGTWDSLGLKPRSTDGRTVACKSWTDCTGGGKTYSIEPTLQRDGNFNLPNLVPLCTCGAQRCYHACNTSPIRHVYGCTFSEQPTLAWEVAPPCITCIDLGDCPTIYNLH